MGDRGGVSYAFDFKIALDGFDDHFTVKIPGLDTELVVREFPEIETQADYHRKLRMDAGEIAGNDGMESTHNGELPGVFLREIAKGEKFNFH